MTNTDKKLLIEKVEKMKKELTYGIDMITTKNYNEALDDVVTLIQGMETEE